MRFYLKQKGQVLCSTCKDKRDAEPPASPAPSATENETPRTGS
jgi:hypothetical protein